MSGHDRRAVDAALLLAAILVALFLVTGLGGCASSPDRLHSWGNGRSPWIDYSGECADFCSI